MAEVRKKPPDWVWRPLTQPDEWCPRCLHNDGAYLIPYHLTGDGVTKHPVHFRCFNCGDWRHATAEEIGHNG